jgi:hypothetical protein
MKKLGYYIAGLGLLLSSSAMAQQANPDQNPNYQVSMDYYMQHHKELTAKQGQTVHHTREAYDWTTAKAEAKQERKDRRYELDKMRYQNRYRCGTYPGYYNGYNNYYNPYYPLWLFF